MEEVIKVWDMGWVPKLISFKRGRKEMFMLVSFNVDFQIFSLRNIENGIVNERPFSSLPEYEFDFYWYAGYIVGKKIPEDQKFTLILDGYVRPYKELKGYDKTLIYPYFPRIRKEDRRFY